MTFDIAEIPLEVGDPMEAEHAVGIGITAISLLLFLMAIVLIIDLPAWIIAIKTFRHNVCNLSA